MSRCRWYTEAGVGRFLVPGCWSRAIYGDNAECHCPPSKGTPDLEDRLDRLERKLNALMIAAAPDLGDGP
jgi:hypothetical protein